MAANRVGNGSAATVTIWGCRPRRRLLKITPSRRMFVLLAPVLSHPPPTLSTVAANGMADQRKENVMLTRKQTGDRSGVPAPDPFAAAEAALREAGIGFTVVEDRTPPRETEARRAVPVGRPMAA